MELEMKNKEEELKQETLEEASWRFNPLKKLDGEFLRAAFIKGAKWQQERSYSEAIDSFITQIKNEFKDDNLDYLEFIKARVIEQFKKK
jgi:hypothetical protein